MAFALTVQAGTALRTVERLASVSVVISSLELLARQRVLGNGNLMGWQLGRLRSHRRVTGVSGHCFDMLMSNPVYRAMLLARAAASAALAVGPLNFNFATVLRSTIGATSVAIYSRSPYGWDGADQMSTITFAGLSAWSIFPRLEQAVIRFLALQLVLSYLASGIAKAVSPEWRSGSALAEITGTKIYGNPRFHDWLQARPGASRLLCRAIIIGECAFALSLIAPKPLRYLMMAGGISFHAATAYVMHLNTFFWSFTAAYPALAAYCEETASWRTTRRKRRS